MSMSLQATSREIHPLRLSLCDVEYTSEKKQISFTLKLFLTDVNQALIFTTSNDGLAFCQPNESPLAESMLLKYLNRFFFIKANGKEIPLKIESKKLGGDGENTALWLYFEHPFEEKLTSLEIKNAVFTDLFFDQNNVVYVEVNKKSKSLMLNKKTPSYLLKY